MPAIPRAANVPMDWKDASEDIIFLWMEHECLQLTQSGYETFEISLDENEVEDFLEWFNSEVRRLYNID